MLILFALTIRTIRSGLSKWANESKAIREAGADAEEESVLMGGRMAIRLESYGSSEPKERSGGSSVGVVEQTSYGALSQDKQQRNEELLAEMLRTEEKIPWGKLGILSFCWVGVNLLDMIRGGGEWNGPFDIDCGSSAYWVVTFLYIPFSVAIAFYVALDLMYMTEVKEEIGYPWHEGDVRWDTKRAILYPLVCSTAGLFAGMFGVGGGIVKGPLMNEMGVLPEVTQATAGFMIFFTASSATVSYGLYGLVSWSYAGLLAGLGFFFTCIGQVFVFWLVDKFGRPSVIVFVIGAILGVSTILLATNGFTLVHDQIECDCTEHMMVCSTLHRSS